jgi:hypothetical protein
MLLNEGQQVWFMEESAFAERDAGQLIALQVSVQGPLADTQVRTGFSDSQQGWFLS